MGIASIILRFFLKCGAVCCSQNLCILNAWVCVTLYFRRMSSRPSLVVFSPSWTVCARMRKQESITLCNLLSSCTNAESSMILTANTAFRHLPLIGSANGLQCSYSCSSACPSLASWASTCLATTVRSWAGVHTERLFDSNRSGNRLDWDSCDQEIASIGTALTRKSPRFGRP
jgi:hypothetical protein